MIQWNKTERNVSAVPARRASPPALTHFAARRPNLKADNKTSAKVGRRRVNLRYWLFIVEPNPAIVPPAGGNKVTPPQITVINAEGSFATHAGYA
ncbi:hypothetical protein EVAR_11673_1 [Eumeta japonica]|uniref:Uncharacterized protein n=1 Tax=Eumeta variegata TaxID=151549 RepID=A0A4C1U4U3_EUMVA|nr:hypothetical protein EVAR_11673_1 [Eumeta japonica]